MSQDLNDAEEALVYGLAGEYIENKYHRGKDPSWDEYLAKLPEERLRTVFIECVHMHELLLLNEDTKRDSKFAEVNQLDALKAKIEFWQDTDQNEEG